MPLHLFCNALSHCALVASHSFYTDKYRYYTGVWIHATVWRPALAFTDFRRMPPFLYFLLCLCTAVQLSAPFVEGSLEVKLPTIWTDAKQSREEAERRERTVEEKESEERRRRCAKREESRETLCFSNDLWLRRVEKVGSLKRRARSELARREMKKCTLLWREAHFQVKMYKTHHCLTTFGSWDVEKMHAIVARSTFRSQNVTKHTSFGPLLEVEMSKKCTPLWREAHFEVKMYKTPQCRTTFGSWDVEKVHAVVARSTFRSQNVQNTPVSGHFWKLRCRKSARRCGAKHISKSKCTKHLSVGRLLEVEMSKKCTPLWREAHFEVKMCKTPQCRTTFGSWDVEKVDAVVARSTFWSQHVKNTTVQTTFGGSDVASRGRCKGLCTLSKVSKTWGFCSIFNYNHHYITLQSNTLDYTTTTTSTTTPSLHSTTLHSTTLHCTQLHAIPLHFTTLHYTTLHNTTTTTTQLHSTTLHYTPLH